MAEHDDDIREVMADEKARGRPQPTEAAARRREAELKRKFWKALQHEDKEAFIAELRELGYADDPERVENALKIWRDFWRGGRPTSRRP